jgi:DNA-binding CsgD family transcriptional regulator
MPTECLAMQALALEDVKSIIRLLGDIGAMTDPIVDRRRALMNRLCRLIRADIWIWVHSRVDPETSYPSAFKLIDGGWRDEAERVSFISALHDPVLNAAIIAKQTLGPHRTTVRRDLLREEIPQEAAILDRWTANCGMRESVTTLYWLGQGVISGLGFHRRAGEPGFSDRERCIVHVIASQLDWLHRAETDVPGNSDKLLQFSPRQREVLVHLMSGDSRREIAEKLHLSEHTVADHMKAIYQALKVSSRPELLTLFMSGAGLANGR